MESLPLFAAEHEAPRSKIYKFTVFGEAEPAGSKTAIPLVRRAGQGRFVAICRANGIPIVNVVDANKNADKWKKHVAHEVNKLFWDTPLAGPVGIRCKFYQDRPKYHYGTGKSAGIVKSSAPNWPTSKPDALKLMRGVEDALTGIVYVDDAQIVEETISKHYGDPRVEIEVWEILHETQ